MILSKEDIIKLNYLAKGEGAIAIEYLSKILYDYYAKEAVLSDGNDTFRNQGAAKLALWLQSLPKGLNYGGYESVADAMG